MPPTKKKRRAKSSHRTRSLGLKVEEEFYWELKEIALREKCQMVKIIEMSVELFKKLKEHEIDEVKIEELIEIFEKERVNPIVNWNRDILKNQSQLDKGEGERK